MRWTPRFALLFCAFGALVLGALNFAGRLPVAGPTEVQEMQANFDRISASQAVSLGGSTGTAIDFDAMCVDGARFFHKEQDVFEIEALIDLILSRPAPPETFFLTISPSTLGHDNGVTGNHRRRITYRFLHGESSWGLIGGDVRQAVLSEAMPAVGHHLRTPWLVALTRPLIGETPVDPERVADTRSIDPTAVDRLTLETMAVWGNVAEFTHYYDPGVRSRTRATLIRIADKIDRAGAQLVVVVPPYFDALRRRIEAADWTDIEEFTSTLDQLSAENVIVRDYWDDSELSHRYEYFRDASHLNAPGARRFSRRLADDLRKRGVVPSQDCD